MERYLYEIIEDYKNAVSDAERDDIFRIFCSSIWSSSNKRRTRTKTIRFSIRKELLETDTGQVFRPWSVIGYNGYDSRTRDTDWCSLIRQKINNLYTRYFDRDIILNKDYIHLLQIPKQLYYQWEGGVEMTQDEAAARIRAALSEAEKKYAFYQKQKMQLSWNDYKQVVEGFLLKIFQTCRLLEECEEEMSCGNIYDFMNEDNFYIRYFCRSLEGAMKKWQKQYYGLRDHKTYTRCTVCGRMIEKTNNRVKYCKACAAAVNRERSRKNMKTKRMFDLGN
ncbi:MAG: hypothetical protein HFG38_12460 [Eubacterium sp.]|nr:hypothetical protein [Eubacterium sp.]